MKKTNKFSKDPKITVVSISKFLEQNNYLLDSIEKLWNPKNRPQMGEKYYKFTPDKLISISYSYKKMLYGRRYTEKLDRIQIAYRDGISEYRTLNDRIEKLKSDNLQNIDPQKLINVINLLPEYNKNIVLSKRKSFDDHLVDLGYRTQDPTLENKFVVFDVETNGMRTSNDDLLALSIYDPTTGICYNKLFPLDLQPLVLTSWINGIFDNDIKYESHLTQKEVDQIIDFFHLENRTILSFSGGEGSFDFKFLTNYCKRHKLHGFENLNYKNIKSYLPQSYILAGQITKDNLCLLFNIDGVNNVHSSQNDCLLEWKLFEKVKDNNLFFIENKLYEYNPKYIIPVTYLNSRLLEVANITLPHITALCEEIYNYHLPQDIISQIKKFPTNITGIAIENGIYGNLNVIKQDNRDFLKRNKQLLSYKGELEDTRKKIKYTILDDGLVKTYDNDTNLTDTVVNTATKIFIENINDVLEFIKYKIFNNERIYNQELCISNDNKILAMCDLSSETKILEIKTKDIKMCDNYIHDESIKRQLFYESKGRKTYLLSIIFTTHETVRHETITDAISITIYSVHLETL